MKEPVKDIYQEEEKKKIKSGPQDEILGKDK